MIDVNVRFIKPLSI